MAHTDTPYENAKARIIEEYEARTLADLRRAAFERAMSNDPSKPPPFDAHNCSVCRNGALPCKTRVVGNCGNLFARND